MAGGAAVGAAASVPVKAYANAEEAATNLKVAMMGVGGVVPDTYKKVTDLATQLGNKLPGTTADFTNMMTMLQRQGLSAEKVLGGVGEATAYLAVQLKKTPEAAAEFAAKMQDATRTVDKDMLGLMDTIQRAYYLGVDDNNMLQGFAKLSPALSILRKEGAAAAKELAPLLVMADQAGMAGEQAGNAYRKIFQLSMGTKKIDKANAALQGTGVQLDFTNGMGEFGGMDHLFSQLGQLKNVNTQKRLAALKEAFGDDAETLQALTLMIEKGKAGYDDVAQRMQAQADIQQRVNAQLGTLKNLWDAAAGTFTNAMAAFGEAIAPQMKAATQWLGSLSERMQIWATQNPAMASALMTTIKWVGLLLLGFGGLAVVIAALLGPFAMAKFALVSMGFTGSVLAPVLTAVTTALKFMGTALLFVARFMLTNPIGLAVTALATAVFLVYQYWEPIKAFFAGIWTSLRTGTTQAWSWVTNHIASMANTFSTLGGQLIDGLIQGLSNKLAQLKATVVGVASSVADWFKEKMGIKSPSRVFMAFGDHTVAGLQKGIEANASGPVQAVQALAAKMAAAGAGLAIGMGGGMGGAMAAIDTRPPITASAAAMGAGAGTSVVNHITIAATPGMDEAALARLVAAEIDKATRRSLVARRSRLTDGD
jgi:TP901 family phage tail tape measure protein